MYVDTTVFKNSVDEIGLGEIVRTMALATRGENSLNLF